MFPQSASTPAPLPTAAADKEQVERILRLAKLGSNPEVVDPILDALRIVTSAWDGQSALRDRDRIRLQEVEAQLKQYVINHDPLRSFTAESLDTYLQSKQSVGSAGRDLKIIIGISLAAVGMAFLPPLFTSFPIEDSFILTIPLFLLVIHAGIAWLYLSSLAHFKAELRRAFLYIGIGSVLLSLAFSHYVALELFNLSNQELFKYGGLTYLAASSYFFMYIGLRQYAKLVGIKSKATSWTTVLVTSTIIIGLAVLLPHVGQKDFEPYFDLGFSGLCMFTTFLAFCTLLSRQITKSVTPAYAKSMHWLYIYFISGFFGSLGGLIALPLVGELNGGFLYVLIAALGIGPQLLLLYTGYSFKKETSTTQ